MVDGGDLADLGTALDRVIRHGLLRRGDEVTGCWWVDEVLAATRDPATGSYGPLMLRHRALSRSAVGCPAGARVTVPLGASPDEAIAAALRAPDPGRHAMGLFGQGLRKLLAMTDPHPPRTQGDVMLAPELALTLAGALRGRDRRDMPAHALSSGRMDRLLATLRTYAASLDPRALDVLRAGAFGPSSTGWHEEGHDHDHAAAARIGRVWPLLDRTFRGDALLPDLMDRHPRIAETLLAAADDDPVGFAADARGDRLAVNVSRRARTSMGLPRHLGDALLPLCEALDLDPDRADDMTRRHAWQRMQDACSRLRRLVDWDEAPALAWGLRDLPASWVPRDAATWSAALDVYDVLTVMDRCLEDGRRDAATFLNVRGDWVAYRDRLRRIVGDVPLRSALEDRMDLAQAFHAEVVAPAHAIARELSTDAALPGHVSERAVAHVMLFSGRSLPRVLEVSAAWHRDVHARMGALEALPGARALGTRWGPALPDHARGDLALKVLVTERELAEEGGRGPDRDGVAGLGHCAGGYGDQCRRGASRVASVRRVRPGGAFARVATVEFVFPDGRPVVTQLRGRGNGASDPDAEAFVDMYVASFGTGERHVTVEDLVPLTTSTAVAQVARYDWTVPGNWEAARDLWRPYLPGPLRDVGPATLVATWEAVAAARLEREWLHRTVRPVMTSPVDGATLRTPVRPGPPRAGAPAATQGEDVPVPCSVGSAPPPRGRDGDGVEHRVGRSPP